MLSDGREHRKSYGLAAFLIGVCTLSFVGAYVVVAAVWGWLT